MNNSRMTWLSPAPDSKSSTRLSLDFGLRSADLYFRDLVVPGLGRIWFARQLSWPLAALALYEELASHGSNAPKATAICHGIEALACKLEYEANSGRETRSRRILGTRAFARVGDSEAWSFHRLREASNYVRNTHRQAATRAVRTDGGLGFARGSRFDLLELEQAHPVRKLASQSHHGPVQHRPPKRHNHPLANSDPAKERRRNQIGEGLGQMPRNDHIGENRHIRTIDLLTQVDGHDAF